MNRSNRLVILVGVLLAVVAFILVVLLLQPGGAGDRTADESPATETVLVAVNDIEIGTPVTPDLVTEEQVDPEAVAQEPIGDASLLGGQPAQIPIPAGSQVTAQAVGLDEGVAPIDISAMLNAGEKAIAFQVDRATGLDFLVTEGDYIDIVMTQQISVLQETADSAANTDADAPPRFEVVTGLENQRTVKAILQNKRVIYVSGTKASQPEPVDVNNDGQITPEEQPAATALESVIIVFAGTDQDAEIIKYAQTDFTEIGPLTAVVRHADDDVEETTLGITIDQLVEEFGLRIPGIVETLDTSETP